MVVVLVWQYRQIDLENEQWFVKMFDVKQARQHNDMNVLCIGADDTNFDTAKAMCKASLQQNF